MAKTHSNARECALRVLLSVLRDGLNLDHALTRHLPDLRQARDQALAQQLAYGVLRYYDALDELAGKLLRKPLDEKNQDLQLCMLLGLEQLWHLNLPPHAAIHATVELARLRKKKWATGMLNAVLRRFQREQQSLLQKLAGKPAFEFSCPDWLLDKLREDWPQHWQSIAQANLQQAPMWLRVNVLKTTREQYIQTLNEQGIDARPGAGVTDICLTKACPVQQLPHFDNGYVSVQDSAAQSAVPLMDLAAGQRVLDACAAPGGKTTQVLESCPQLAHLTALDVSAQRVTKVHENLQRLGLDCELVTADALHLDSWWDGQCFDRVLLDAPCSSSGVIRRHPDIKHRLQPENVLELADLQSRLLKKLWSVVQPGGMLVYVTCSVFAEENQQVIRSFVKTHPEARLLPIDLPLGQPIDNEISGWQILPGTDNTDGLFFARLQKNSEPFG